MTGYHPVGGRPITKAKMTETSRAQHLSSVGLVYSDDLSRQRVVAWGQEMRDIHRRLVDALDIARKAVEAGGRPESGHHSDPAPRFHTNGMVSR